MCEGPYSEEIYSNSTIYDFLLIIVTAAVLLNRLLDVIAYRGWKSSVSPIGKPSNIDVIYTSLKSTFSGLQFCRRQYGFIYIRLAVVASQISEITRNSEKIWTYDSSRSFKVIDLGVNRKRICDFLLVINSNYERISYRFDAPDRGNPSEYEK